MKSSTTLTKLLNITYPIIQAPMLGVTSPEMVAAVANEGGLGSLPVGGLSPEKTLALIRQTKALTDKPFAVNLFTHDIPAFDAAEVEAMQDFLEKLSAENHLKFERQPIDSFQFYSYKEQIDILLSENIPVVSFTFGMLDGESIKALQQNNTILIGTATCLKEAKMLADIGIDIIAAQGIEAGGHRGTFITDEPLPQVGLMSLLAQIVSHVNRPVIACGGINDAGSMRAAFELGAQGVQVGTAFIASDESLAIPSYKTALQSATDTDAVLTRMFSGRWARGLRNKFMEELENSRLSIPPYPIQNILTGTLRASAQQQDNKDFTNLWAGQSAYKVEMKPTAEIFKTLAASFG